MPRWFALIALTSCVPGYHMPHGGVCPTDRGCEAPVEPEPKYMPPDEDHPVSEPETVETVLADKPVTCEQVAVAQASFELGNYATDEDRRPLLQRYTAACTREHPSAEVLGCLGEAADLQQMAYCAPVMFPQVRLELTAPDQCAALVRGMQNRVERLQFSVKVAVTLGRKLTALRASCEQDTWPAKLGACVAAGNWQPRGIDTDPLENCLPLASSMLKRRIAARLDLTSR